MSKFPVKYLLLPIALLTSSQVLAEVTVHFQSAEQYTDLAIGGPSTPANLNDLLKEFEKYFIDLGERYLPEGDKLEIVVLDIDMAGANESRRTPDYDDARFFSDMSPPIIKLHYIWHDKAGKLKTDKHEEVTEQNFVSVRSPSSGYYTNNDPLHYEKALLDRWFSRTFSSVE